MIFFR